MLRFRNPGTQYSTQVQVIKQLYAALGHQESFSLNDMAVVIAQGRLMTAYGYAGDDAIRLSMTDQESMNSALVAPPNGFLSKLRFFAPPSCDLMSREGVAFCAESGTLSGHCIYCALKT